MYDDIWNAEQFIALHGDDLRYVPQYKEWMVWDGSRWEQNPGGAMRLAIDFVKSLHDRAAEALASGNTDRYKELTRHITKSAGRLEPLLRAAASYSEVEADATDFDSILTLLNCRDCVLDLTDGEPLIHNPLYYMTRRAGASFKVAQEPTPNWDKFLASVVPDPSAREYLQRLAGYTTIGGNPERIIVFLYGDGRNGKSTFVETVRHVLGDYAVNTQPEVFTHTNNSTTGALVRLKGARMITASEFEEGAAANIALLKRITGDEQVTDRQLYGKAFDFDIDGVIWISTNHMPWVGNSRAVWDRIRTVPFNVRIPDTEVDVHLKEKLRSESSGILRWLIQGALAYQEHGLEAPASCLEASVEIRLDQDTLAPFLDDCCEIDAQYSVSSTELYDTYRWWAVKNGEKVLSHNALSRRLSEAGFVKHRSSRARLWHGMRLRSSAEVNAGA